MSVAENKRQKAIVTPNEVKEYLQTFKTKKVLIIGDVMVDSYMWGKVNRISPEAPIPVVSVTNSEYRLGGAANVAININSLGATTYLCSVIGNDEKAKVFKSLLNENKLSDIGIICKPNRKTTVKTRIISSNQHLLRVDDEIDTNIDKETADELIEKVKNICCSKGVDIIIFEDYDKGVLTEYIIKEIVEYSKSSNILTSADPKKRNFLVFSNINLFKPNFKEFCEGVKCEISKNDINGLKDYSRKYIYEHHIEKLILTLSEQGLLICDKRNCVQYPAIVRDIADVSGAGDTVISMASLLLASGANNEHIAYLSNIAGGLVCEKAGVVPITPESLMAELD
ncbi:MAG TPA: bifunctional ADP-heptose synthase [Bacteroidales bacterium]|nr:bifunctional ADP-heptose synthase [Bacteroidales bacterium]